MSHRATDRNRSRIILTLAQRGPLSRAELARLSDVTRSTIGSYVERLLDDGLIEEVESAPSGARGRPSRPVWFKRDAARCGAIVFDEDRVEVGLVNPRGEVLSRATTAISPRIDTDAIADRIERLLDEVVGPAGDLVGIGIAITGVVGTEAGTVDRLARFPNVDGNALLRRIDQAAGARVVAENDAHCGALAELWWGHGRLHRSFWTVQIGEGIGGCGVMDGELTRGTRGHAGEIGHTTVDLTGQLCVCGIVGCWETIASLRWLRDQADERAIPKRRARTIGQIAALAADGDERASSLLEDYTDNLAIGLTNLIHLVAPGLVVLQGDVTEAGPDLLRPIRHAIGRRSLTGDDHGVDIRFSELGADARLLGAGALVMSTTWSLDP